MKFQVILLGLLWMVSANAKTIIPGIRALPLNTTRFSFAKFTLNINPRRERQKENVVEILEDKLHEMRSASSLEQIESILGIDQKARIGTEGFKLALNDLKKKVHNFETSPAQLKSSLSGKYIENPAQAHCQPDIKPVDLGVRSTDDIFYYPTCVRIKQCGGCCPQDVYSCQPAQSEKVFVKVMKIASMPEDNEVSSALTRGRRRRRKVTVTYENFNITVEEHNECTCLCRLKESECDPLLHTYDSQYCSCTCNNLDDEVKCLEKNTHIWNNKTCKCLCRKPHPCSTGEEFDHNTCSCRIRELPFLWEANSNEHQSKKPIFFPGEQRSPVLVHSPSPIQNSRIADEVEADNLDGNSLKTFADFAKYFNVSMPIEPLISVRLGKQPIEMEQALCETEIQTVPLNLPNDTGITYFPTCVRVEQCGGCCYLDHYSCQPIETETIEVKVVKVDEGATRSRRRSRNAESGILNIQVEKHVQCQCKCKLQESECNSDIHIYDDRFCACNCKNQAEELACYESPNHLWYNDSCTCRCRNPFNCTTGMVFDHRVCDCVIDDAGVLIF